MNYLQFALKGPKYSRNKDFLLMFLQIFWNIRKKLIGVFLTLNICRKLGISVISSNQLMSLVSIFWVIWGKGMQTREAPNFGELHKNKNCTFPVNLHVLFEKSLCFFKTFRKLFIIFWVRQTKLFRYYGNSC